MIIKRYSALVAVSNTAYSFDKLYSYSVPEGLLGCAVKGVRVLVPFGRGSEKRTGLIFSIHEEVDDNSLLKPILCVLDSSPVLNSEMLEMAEWLKDNTFCTYFDAINTIIPSGMRLRISEEYSLSKKPPKEQLTDEENNLYVFLEMAKSKSEFNRLISDMMSTSKLITVNSLIQKGVLVLRQNAKQNISDSSIKMVRLSENYIHNPESFMLTSSQKKIASLLSENGAVSAKEACYVCGVTSVVVNNLIKCGAVEDYEYEQFRIPDNSGVQIKSIDDIILSEHQKTVFEPISEHISALQPLPKAFLLHGITGSGKTSVFAKLIAEVMKKGRQTIFLIPEISLTPQVADYFLGLFGDTVAILHSGLPLSRRFDEYKRIKQGKARIIVGTRSAVFAPCDNIGLIIMDEEGERTYKSEAAPRYNTVSVARKRCKTHNAVLLLASATPSVESYYLAEKGVYQLLELTERYHKSKLPEVRVKDMTLERENGNFSSFSNELIDEMTVNLERGEQSILLLNRRGYHTIVSCCDCRKPVFCPNCSIPLTYHKTNDRLMCHYCGHIQPNVEECPECGSRHLKQSGFGTQKLEEELQLFFPEARILRMDADTALSGYSYEKNFSDFAKGEYDILLGTQMIGKGLDFPNVTLVGVLSVDKALFAGDFKSYERTFSLVTQVVGRGGRADKPGRAYLQTFIPDHYVLKLAAMQDYKRFYDEEISIRRALTYPPLCDICVIALASPFDEAADEASKLIISILAERIKNDKPDFPLRVLGPVKSALEKINGKYRYKIIIKCKNTVALRSFVSSVLIEAGKHKETSKVSIYADLNGEI